MKKNNDIKQEWLEFKYNNNGDSSTLAFVNLKRSEISEVVQCFDVDSAKPVKKWSKIYMKNGRSYFVYMSYDKVMELI